MEKLNVLVVDDHPLYLNGLRDALVDEEFINEVGTATNGKEAIEELNASSYDIILLDLFMPVMDGVETTKYVVKEFPKVPIIILTSTDSRKQIAELLEMGVGGYLLKGSDKGEITAAIKAVVAGEVFLTPDVKRIYNDFILEQAKNVLVKKETDNLTKREVEILREICLQLTTTQIAEKLYLSPYTINNHRYNISVKTGISNSIGLVLYAIRNGHFDPKKDNPA